MSLYPPLNAVSGTTCGHSHSSPGHVSANANAPLPNGVPPAAPPPPPTPDNGAHANALPMARRAAHPYAGLSPEHPTAPFVAADPQRAWAAPLYRAALRAEDA